VVIALPELCSSSSSGWAGASALYFTCIPIFFGVSA
jgi:hypothetical protein